MQHPTFFEAPSAIQMQYPTLTALCKVESKIRYLQLLYKRELFITRHGAEVRSLDGDATLGQYAAFLGYRLCRVNIVTSHHADNNASSSAGRNSLWDLLPHRILRVRGRRLQVALYWSDRVQS